MPTFQPSPKTSSRRERSSSRQSSHPTTHTHTHQETNLCLATLAPSGASSTQSSARAASHTTCSAASHPLTPEESAAIANAGLSRNPTEVTLITYLPSHIRQGVVRDGLIPLKDRWRSFGWEVTSTQPVTRIPFEDIPEYLLPSCYREA